MRLHSKLLLIFTGLIAILLLLGIYLNMMSLSRNKSSRREQVENSVSIASSAVNSDISNISNALKWLSVSGKINLLNVYPDSMSIGGKVMLLGQIQRQIDAMIYGQPLLKEVTLVLSDVNRKVDQNYLYKELTPTETLFFGQFTPDSNVVVSGDNLWLYCILTSGQRSSPKGMVSATLSIHDVLSRMTFPIGPTNGADDVGFAARLTNGERTLALIGASPEHWASDTSLKTWTKERGRWTLKYPIPSLALNGLNVLLELSLSEQMLYGDISMQYWIWAVIQSGVALLSLVCFAWLLNRSVTVPFRRTVNAFLRLEQGDLDAHAESGTSDEFSDISKEFNEIAHRYKASVEQAFAARMQVQQAELMRWQTQINPHFLYNSFYHIYRMCKMQDSELAARFSMLLSQYYEYITHSATLNSSVELIREYKHAATYVEIQRMRLGERFDAELDELLDAYKNIIVPQLVLQPIIENVIKHVAEEDANADGTQIHVSTRTDNGYLVILVEDNGKHLTDERLGNLKLQLAGLHLETQGIGLVNVHQRLKIFMGGQSGIRLSRAELGGLCVEMWMKMDNEGVDARDAEVFDRR